MYVRVCVWGGGGGKCEIKRGRGDICGIEDLKQLMRTF